MKNKIIVKIIVLAFFAMTVNCVSITSAEAKTKTKRFFVKSGHDTTGGSALAFGRTTLSRLKKSDNKIATHDYFWPAVSYDEARYVEFDFRGQSKKNRVPVRARINEVKLILEFTTTNVVSDAIKIEVWDGENWSHEHVLNMPAVGVDSIQTLDLSSYINNRSKVNNLKFRFLAIASEPSQVLFDQVKLNIKYRK